MTSETDQAATAIQNAKRQKEARAKVAAKKAEKETAQAASDAKQKDAAQSALSAGAKGYAQRKAAKKKKDEQEQAATVIGARFRGKKERVGPDSEVNARRERNKNDPQLQASAYLEQHKLLPLFELLGQQLVTEQPADPRAFLLAQLEKLQKVPDKTSPLNFFSEDEIDTLYAMYDQSKSGLTAAQCKEALTAIGLEGVEVPAYTAVFDLAAFAASFSWR